MYAIGEKYYNINQNVLKMLGLWPYQKSYFVQIQKVLLIGILITYILVQLLVFFTTKYNLNLLLKILSFVFPVLFVTIKYCMFVIKADNVKQILEQIRDDWNLSKDKLEIDILIKYAYQGRLLMIVLIALCNFGLIFAITFQSLPIILDVISPLNESRPRRLIVIVEYFINQEKYFYVLLMHEILVACIGIFTLCCTGVTIIMYILHACALLKIARLVEFLTSNFIVPFVILTLIGVSSLSINLFQFLQIITSSNNFGEAVLIALIICCHLTYMFFGNYGGQEIIDSGIHLFKATYNGLWYLAPLQTQKLLLFVMQRGMKNVNLSGYIFVASLEGFATLTSTAISYFTIIYSTR